MTLTLVVTLAGTPRPQPRPRFVHGRVVSTGAAKPKAWAKAVERAAREAVANLGGVDAVAKALGGHALALAVLFEFPTPNTTRWGQPHTVRPDGDNLAKLVLDRLMAAGALGGDDSRVVDLVVRKVWAQRGSMSVRVSRAHNTTRTATRSEPLAAAPVWLRR